MGNVYFPRGFSISKLTQSPFKVCNEVGRIMFKFSQHIIQHHIYAPLIRKSNITNLLTWKSSLGSTAQEIEVWWDWVNFVPSTLPSPSRVSRLISGNNVHMKQVLDAFGCISVNNQIYNQASLISLVTENIRLPPFPVWKSEDESAVSFAIFPVTVHYVPICESLKNSFDPISKEFF